MTLEEACKAIKKSTQLNVSQYKFIIEEKYIRHVQNNHEDDLYLLPKLPDILNSFSHVEKSITRNTQTGQNDVVQMVSLRVLREKILTFKTFFRK